MKLLTPIYATLREKGFECFPYIDDSFIIADTEQKCRETVEELKDLLEILGFVIHQGKSILCPTQSLDFLGFTLNSEEFKVFLTREKEEKLSRASWDVLSKDRPTIREVAGLIGLMIAYAHAFDYASLYTKKLEIDKIQALKVAHGDFGKTMKILEGAKEEFAGG